MLVVILGGVEVLPVTSTTDLIDQITISTLGNAQDFGNFAALPSPGCSVMLFHLLNSRHHQIIQIKFFYN